MLSDCLRPEIVREYPHVRELLFMSTVDANEEYSYSHVANTPTGYAAELERCAQSSSQVGTGLVQANPYSTRLMPVSVQDDVVGIDTGVMLEQATFIGYDATLSGSPLQNAANNAEIIASQASPTDAYVASHFRFGIMGNWQPNYCRPEIRIDGVAILSMGDSQVVNPATETRAHLGHMSIGVALPYTVHFYREMDRVRNIEVFCPLGQPILSSAEPTEKIVRYPVLCMMRWRTR
ncbi:MAG: hypothetical protein BGO89_06835 [Candidatus Kapaibacterium thiocyanatum]|uniref:Uncharacterized protein n=1 Tax=Candidatus Kapaibacterium thiocyanatum TaxID=1895771 RepID=A0A1M3KYW2_9BACT|nr:MAG: hypothetical protein BGO89_06835 ['Candidatus Kapabacteria' thiocyanatum]